MNKLICLFVLAASAIAHADPSSDARAQVLAQLNRIESAAKVCFDKNLDQMGMNACAGNQADAADALLNKVYQAKMRRLNPEQQRTLRNQERQFVIAKIRAEKEIEEDGGSIAPMESSSSDYELTKKQILKLLK